MSDWLDAAAAPGAIVGGVAASILGRPRLTEDIDVLVLIEREEWSPFLAAGRPLGFIPRIDDALDLAETSRVLLVAPTASIRWRSAQPTGTAVPDEDRPDSTTVHRGSSYRSRSVSNAARIAGIVLEAKRSWS